LIALLLADEDTHATRSVMALAVSPPRFRSHYLARAEFHHLLDRQFSQCEAVLFCANANPDGKQKLISILQRLKQHPVTLEVRIFSDKF
jgi:hypothetical protein